MSDFITISCPSCGGMLSRGASTTTYTCDYCGQQHRLRVEDIEEFGRCPVCQRNDRVEIVRALYNKGDNLSKRFAPPHKPEILRYDPKAKPGSIEKPTFTPRTPDPREVKNRKIFHIFSIVLLLLSFYFFAKSENMVIPILLLILACASFLYPVIVDSIKDTEDACREQQILDDWKSKNQEINYQKAKRRYDNLYYCHRDDCVFIPGESGYAPSAKMDEFLFKETAAESSD